MKNHDFQEESQERLRRILPSEHSTAMELLRQSPLMAGLILQAYLPEADAQIFTRDQLRRFLEDFAADLLDTQAQWLVRND